MIRHIVHLRFAPEVTDARKQGLYTSLAGLCDELDGMIDFRSFANVSPETGMARGFGDMFWVDFRDAAARDAYLVDTRHVALAAHLLAATEGGIDGLFVCDIELPEAARDA